MADLLQGLRGELWCDVPMHKHTSWRVGGPAERAYIPADVSDLAQFLRGLPENEPVHVFGLGSNLLVRDGGVRGTVIFTHGALKHWRSSQASPFVLPSTQFMLYAEAGVASPVVARTAARHALAGGEFMAGIPGTVGGALRMNAGCYGSETWEIVERVLTVDRSGNLKQRAKAEYEIGYRSVALKIPPIPSLSKGGASRDFAPQPSILNPEFFAAAWFRFSAGDRKTSLEKIRALLARRIASQPLSIPNAGSVFRNPPGDHAARLIEASGLKGAKLGGAIVSPQHANFIVNCGGASAADIEILIEKVHTTVFERTGIDLVREVEIVGEPE